MQNLFYVLNWILLILLIVLISFLIWWGIILRIIRRYHPFPIPAFMTQVIDNPIRRRFIQKPHLIAERMNLKPGMIVVEVGPGKGSYTKAVAEKILPDGKVYATDIQQGVLDRLKKRIDKEKLTNIIPQIENAHEFTFKDESIDRVFMISCLPEIPNPIKVLKECKRILKPDGLVSLSELAPDPDYPRRKTEKRWAKEAGLVFKEQFGNWFTYQLNFGKE